MPPEGRSSKLTVLKKLYDRGMNSAKRKDLIKEAEETSACSRKQIMHFIYNTNKKKKGVWDTDLEVCVKEIKRNPYQTFQGKLAKDAKHYGTRYSNSTVKNLWKNLKKDNNTMKKETILKKVKGKELLGENENKIQKSVEEICSLNLCSVYARLTPLGSKRIICSPLVKEMMESFLITLDKKFGMCERNSNYL